MEKEFEQKRCKVDNALLFEISKDGHQLQIKCRKCGSIRLVKLAHPSEGNQVDRIENQAPKT